MLSRRRLIFSAAAGGLTGLLPARATVVEVAFQPLAAQAKRVIEAMEYVGEPLVAADRRALERLIGSAGEGNAANAIQHILDRYALVNVAINPESRVSVTAGQARPVLVENGWRVFLVKVINESGMTAQLRAESPQALPDSEHAPGSRITATGIVPPGASRSRAIHLCRRCRRPLA